MAYTLLLKNITSLFLTKVCCQLNKKVFLIVYILCLSMFGGLFLEVQAQETGNNHPFAIPRIGIPDTMMVFSPSKPLFSDTMSSTLYSHIWGVELLFSDNGFGTGFVYQKLISKKVSGFIHLGVSGARNTDEIEYIDPYTGYPFIPGKVNRLFCAPLTVGIQYRLFSNSLSESFRPFLSCGIGPALIVQAKYDDPYFTSISNATLHGRPAGFLGFGAGIGNQARSMLSIQGRYYYIPFGDKGLESIKDIPIRDFGGFFISLQLLFSK